MMMMMMMMCVCEEKGRVGVKIMSNTMIRYAAWDGGF
jgi:hypothetical protein